MASVYQVVPHYYKYVTEASKAVACLDKIASNCADISLDIETTALKPSEGKVRLTSIGYVYNGVRRVIVIDHFKTGIEFRQLEERLITFYQVFVFHSKFECAWINEYFSENWYKRINIVDIAMIRKALEGGGGLSLALAAKWDLGITMNKELQNSNWAAPELSQDQVKYAALDAAVTHKLAMQYCDRVQASSVVTWKAINILNDAVLPCLEIETYGLGLDVEYHKRLIAMWERRVRVSERVLRKLVPETHLPNLNSKKQISDLLKANLPAKDVSAWPQTEKSGQLDLTRDQLRIASARSTYPLSRFFAALMVYNRAKKYLSTYGESLLTINRMRGAVVGNVNIGQAVTLRSSSSAPNMQNLPRSPLVRRSFTAPPGCKLVMADYKGIEIRVLAELSGDQGLLEAQIYGDVHMEGACAIYKIDPEKFKYFYKVKKDSRYKEMRSRAKVFTFRLTYGAGPGALSVSLRCSTEDAAKAMHAWAGRFTRAFNYRQYQFELMQQHGALFLPIGARIFVPRADRTMPVAANYPVQGTAAMVMYAALRRVWNLLQERNVGAVLSATVHDEILLTATEGEEEAAARCLEEGMIQGYLDIFPNANTDNLVDLVIGHSWAEKP